MKGCHNNCQRIQELINLSVKTLLTPSSSAKQRINNTERRAAFLFLHQHERREKKDMDLRRSKVGATTASSAVDISGLTEQCTSWWGKRAVSLPIKRMFEGRASTTLAPHSKEWPSNHPHTHSFSKSMPYKRGVMCHLLGELPSIVGEALELVSTVGESS